MVRIIRNKFPQAFENNSDSSGKWVLTDDCPRQSFKQVLKAYNEVIALPFKIPRRFFVLNPPQKCFWFVYRDADSASAERQHCAQNIPGIR